MTQPEIIRAVITALITALVGGVAGWALAALKDARHKQVDRDKAQDAREEALCAGMRALLRAELVEAHQNYYETGASLTMELREHLESVYVAYHGLGGNGTGTKIWEDLKTCQIIG